MNTDKRKRLSLGKLHAFSARFPADVWEWVKAQAEAAGLTTNAWMMKHFREMMEQEAKKKGRGKT